MDDNSDWRWANEHMDNLVERAVKAEMQRDELLRWVLAAQRCQKREGFVPSHVQAKLDLAIANIEGAK